MTQEEKELLLKDLSARLPYGPIVSVTDGTVKYNAYIESVSYKNIQVSPVSDSNFTTYTFYKISEIKPYLRPMSSMTEEEWEELNCIGHIVPLYDGCFGVDMRAYCKNGQPHYRRFSDFSTIEDWLNAHHLDYHGLISMNLALEAPEGMYNIKEHNKI